MKKGLTLILVLTIFLSLFSFIISAQPPFETNVGVEEGLQLFYPPFEYAKQNADFNLHLHVSNITNGFPLTNDLVSCYLHLYNTTGDHTFESGVLEKDSNLFDHEIMIDGGNFSDIGTHAFYIWCNNSDVGGEVKGGFDVISNGGKADYNYLVAMIVLIITFVGFGILIYLDKKNIDEEKYWNRIVSKWKDKNYLKFSATVIWYNMRKNSYVLNYLIGLIIMIMIYDITLVYNLTSIILIFKILLGLYITGALFVVIVFFGSVQEWLMEWKDEIAKINWGGFGNGK